MPVFLFHSCSLFSIPPASYQVLARQSRQPRLGLGFEAFAGRLVSPMDGGGLLRIPPLFNANSRCKWRSKGSTPPPPLSLTVDRLVLRRCCHFCIDSFSASPTARPRVPITYRSDHPTSIGTPRVIRIFLAWPVREFASGPSVKSRVFRHTRGIGTLLATAARQTEEISSEDLDFVRSQQLTFVRPHIHQLPASLGRRSFSLLFIRPKKRTKPKS